MALSSIKNSRFRSFLTMFGIIIGVVSVITTVSLGEGIKKQVSGQVNEVGNNVITVRPGSLVKRDADHNITGINLLSFLSASSITEKDYEAIKSNPDIQSTVPLSIVPGAPTLNKERYSDGFIMATTADMPKIMKKDTEFGNFFTDSDPNRKTAVIGRTVAEKLFKENVPIGKTFQLRGQDFVVAGVFEKFPTNPLSPEIDYNNGVYIPYGAGKALNGGELKMYQILAATKNENNVPQVVNTVVGNLKDHRGGEEDFTVLTQAEMVAVAGNVLHMLTYTITIMAAVTLFVGGVGIMNVMLVSVTERTREIGIRKAVGATNRQIQSQFLIEAVVISIWGAVVGVLLSGVVNFGFRIFTNLEPSITWQIVLISTGVSVAVGVVFGMIPAVKAARKDPIEALRSY